MVGGQPVILVAAGMKRSGSTLQYNLARHLLAEGEGEAHGYWSASRISSNRHIIREWEAAPILHLIKTHDYPDADLAAERVLYIYRDPRGVAASIEKKIGRRPSDLLSRLEASRNRLFEIKRVAASGGEGSPTFCIQRYGEVIRDRGGAVREIARFIGTDPGESVLEDIIARTDPGRTRRRLEDTFGGSLPKLQSVLSRYLPMVDGPVEESSLLHPDHISDDEGANRWESILSRRDLEEIEAHFGDWIELCRTGGERDAP